MDNERIKKYIEKTKEAIIFILLSLWCIMPILKEVKATFKIAAEIEYKLIELIGLIGIYLLAFNIYKNTRKKGTTKTYIEEIIPIIIFTLYMIWTLISAICAKDKTLAFYGTDYRLDGYITYIGYAGFFMFAYLLKSEKLKKALLNLLLIVAISNIALTEIYSRTQITNLLMPNSITTGVFSQFNHYGYYLLIAAITANLLFITEKNKIIKLVYLLAYTYILYYLIYNNTFGCYLALFATLVILTIYSIVKKEKGYLSVISIIIFIIMSFNVQTIKGKNIAKENITTFFNDIGKIASSLMPKQEETKVEENQNNQIGSQTETNQSNETTSQTETGWEKAGSNRALLWKNGIQFFLKKPILGYGPENLGLEYQKVNITTQDRPHNLLIQLATTSGLPGLLLYLAAVGLILKRAIKTIKTENQMHMIALFVVIAYLISAMFGNSMYYTSPYFFMFLGLLMHENEKQIKKP